MTSMVERVARQLCVEAGGLSFDDLPEKATYLERKTHPERVFEDRQDALDVAGRVIREMRDPTAAMIDAGDSTEDRDNLAWVRPEDIWRDMIDAALSEVEQSAGRTRPVLIDIGETIPGVPNVRLGTFITTKECEEMGELACPGGGYLVWNNASDWFIVPVQQVVACAELPRDWIAEKREPEEIRR